MKGAASWRTPQAGGATLKEKRALWFYWQAWAACFFGPAVPMMANWRRNRAASGNGPDAHQAAGAANKAWYSARSAWEKQQNTTSAMLGTSSRVARTLSSAQRAASGAG